MEPVEDQQNDNEERPTPSATIKIPAESLRIVGMAAALFAGLMLAGSVLSYFTADSFQFAIILAGIAVIDPVIMQFVLSRLRAGGISADDVNLDSPFERYFYEKDLKQAQGGQLGQMLRPVLGGTVLLMLVGMVMDAAELSARVLPLFVLWAGAAFILAMFAGSLAATSDSK